MKKYLVLLAAMVLLSLCGSLWAQCPEDPNDLGECDTLYAVAWPHTDTCFIDGTDTVCINEPGELFPCFWYVYLLVTHDSNTFWWESSSKWVQDSIAGFVIPLTWTRTNPTKYCSLSAYWNTDAYTGPQLNRSVFRDHGGAQNRMLDLQWGYPAVQVSTSPPYFRMAVLTMFGEQEWWEGNKTLLATLTFRLEDTMTVSFDSTFWPPGSSLSFTRIDAQTYVPRLSTSLPDTVLIADFSAYPTSVAPACTVQFIDWSLGNPTSWLWDFGDETTDTLRNPKHSYGDTGYYDVKLVVANEMQTDSITKYDYIRVFSPGHIAGFVRNAMGQPVYPAEVEIHELSWTNNTDPSGYYEFINVEPDSYTLITKASDCAVVETTVTVVAQETTWVDFTLDVFFSVTEYPLFGSFTYSLATGDFNGDNNVDIVALGTAGPAWGINSLWGHGDGTFSLQALIPSDGIVLVKGYFNPDDFLDLAVACWDSMGIFLNDGSGGFLAPTHHYLHGEQPMSIASGFLNSDANLDLVTANAYTRNLSIFSGVGNGDFSFVKSLNVPYVHSADIGDFDRDGNADLVLGTTDSLIVLLGDGNWNFTPSYARYFGCVYSVTTMNSLADFDHDGDLDVVFVLPWGIETADTNRIAVLLGDGAGGFSSVTIFYELGAQLTAVAPGDFNGDNNLDFVTGINPVVKVYYGDGNGSFPAAILNDIGDHALSLGAGDFNEDGNEDIVAGRLDDQVSVLLNLNPPKPTIEDEFVLTGYTSLSLEATDPYGSSANVWANAIAGADYYQKDCDLDSYLDDRLYNFNAIPGRYEVGVTLRPGSEPGDEPCIGIRVNGGDEALITVDMKDLKATSQETLFFTITDSLPLLCYPADSAYLDTDTVTFFWNQIEGTSQYHFQLDDTSDFSSPVVDDSAVADTSLSLASPLSGGTHYWRVRANGGVWSVYSVTYSFYLDIRGDVTGDWIIDIADVMYLINYLFIDGSAPDPMWVGDCNRDGAVDVADVMYLINYLFIGGSPPGS